WNFLNDKMDSTATMNLSDMFGLEKIYEPITHSMHSSFKTLFSDKLSEDKQVYYHYDEGLAMIVPEGGLSRIKRPFSTDELISLIDLDDFILSDEAFIATFNAPM